MSKLAELNLSASANFDSSGARDALANLLGKAKGLKRLNLESQKGQCSLKVKCPAQGESQARICETITGKEIKSVAVAAGLVV